MADRLFVHHPQLRPLRRAAFGHPLLRDQRAGEALADPGNDAGRIRHVVDRGVHRTALSPPVRYATEQSASTRCRAAAVHPVTVFRSAVALVPCHLFCVVFGAKPHHDRNLRHGRRNR